MPGLSKVPVHIRACPFCGVATELPHETQEGCIAALHDEIGRMRRILATLKPTQVPRAARESDDQSPAAAIRLVLDS